MKLTNHEALIENGKPRLWISKLRQATCRGPILIEGWKFSEIVSEIVYVRIGRGWPPC